MPVGPITVPKLMEYLGHFQHLQCCTPASQCQHAGRAATSEPCATERAGSTNQQLSCLLGCWSRGALHCCSNCQCLGKLSLMCPMHCSIHLAGRSHVCQKAGWTVLKENNFSTCYIIFLLCLPSSIFFCHVTSAKKNQKCKWEAAGWNKHIKVVCFHLIWKLYHIFQVNPLGNIIPTRWGQHFYNVWNISFRFARSLFTVHMLCIS